MSTIETEIAVIDSVTAPFIAIEQISSSLSQSFANTGAELDRAFEGSTLKNMEKSFEHLKKSLLDAHEDIEILTSKIGELEKQLAQTKDRGAGLRECLGGIAARFGAMFTIQKTIQTADSLSIIKTRIEQINDGSMDTAVYMERLRGIADRTRTNFIDLATSVTQLQQRTGDLFSNDEALAFGETISKMFTIAGMTAQEISSVSLQLSQALGSGVLRGDEFNSIAEAAPNILTVIAEYMGVAKEEMRDLASKGVISADIVKNAILSQASVTSDTSKAFEQMGMTWEQVWNKLCNTAIEVTTPLLEIISLVAENFDLIAPAVYLAAAALGAYTLAMGTSMMITKMSAFITAMSKGIKGAWSLAVWKQTYAQHGLNAALMACPLVWIIGLIMVVIAVASIVVKWINKIENETYTVTGGIIGIISTLVAVIVNAATGVAKVVKSTIEGVANVIVAVVNFIANVVQDPPRAIAHLVGDLFCSILGFAESVVGVLDFIFGTDWAGEVAGLKNNIKNFLDSDDEFVKVAKEVELDWGLLDERLDYSTTFQWAMDKGAELWGLGQEEEVPDFSDLAKPYEDIATQQIEENKKIEKNTGRTADALEMTEEDLKLILDRAETETINRFTTAEIKINMTNNNNIENSADLDGIISELTMGVENAMNKAAMGVYN